MYQKRNKELEVLVLFLGDYTKQLYLREVSRLAKLPVKTTQNTLLSLEKQSILKSALIGKNKYFKLNLDSIKTKLFILQAEIYKTGTFLDKYQPFKIFLKEIKTNNAVIVFGSFAKLKAEKESDADLLVISDEKQKLPSHLLPYKIHETRLSEDLFIESIKKQENLIKEIEENHVILNNHSFYVDAMWRQNGR